MKTVDDHLRGTKSSYRAQVFSKSGCDCAAPQGAVAVSAGLRGDTIVPTLQFDPTDPSQVLANFASFIKLQSALKRGPSPTPSKPPSECELCVALAKTVSNYLLAFFYMTIYQNTERIFQAEFFQFVPPPGLDVRVRSVVALLNQDPVGLASATSTTLVTRNLFLTLAGAVCELVRPNGFSGVLVPKPLAPLAKLLNACISQYGQYYLCTMYAIMDIIMYTQLFKPSYEQAAFDLGGDFAMAVAEVDSGQYIGAGYLVKDRKAITTAAKGCNCFVGNSFAGYINALPAAVQPTGWFILTPQEKALLGSFAFPP